MNAKNTSWMTAAIALCALSVNAAEPALKAVYANDFLIGSAINRWQFSDSSNQDLPIISKHFNTITAENAMKWESLHRPDKRAGAVKLIKMLQDAGVRIDAIGMQAHYRLETPHIEEIEASMRAYIESGVKVMFTELDIKAIPTPGPNTADVSRSRAAGDSRWNPYPDELPDKVQEQLADRYTDMFKLLLKYRDSVTRVTFWGVTDQTSWLNNFPIRGRTDYPLLFGRDRKPKPAFHAVVNLRTK